MKHIISMSEILGTIHDGDLEVCATAEAEYSAADQKVSVALDAFARRSDPSKNGQHLPEPWLPARERVSEHLPREEADDFTKDVFHTWVRKVRASVPSELSLRP